MAGGPFNMDRTGSSLPSSLPTSPPPAHIVFSRPDTGPRPTPAPQAGVAGTSGGMPGVPTNDEIEAKIQAAMSSASSARSPMNPPRDTRTQLFVGNLPYRVRWQDLKDLFRRSGTVLRADVSLGPDNRSRGYGTVLLATAEDAGRAIDMFNGYVWQTRTLEVRPDKLGLGGGVGMGPGTGMGINMGIGGGVGLGMGADGVAGYGVGGFSADLGVGLGALGELGAGVGGVSTPLQGSAAQTARSDATSPFLTGARDELGTGDSLPPSLVAHLARIASPNAGAGQGSSLGNGNGSGGMSLNSPLLASPRAVSVGISLNSPRGLQSQLSGPVTPTVAGERSRNLFVGNLPFHVQWQDLKDLFRQAGTIRRADVALGPEGRSRGFGTVSFATESDAERAVKMFNGHDYNGRQLKVHYDKFSASSTSAVPLTGFSSMSAPQSPHPQLYSTAHPGLSHAASLAQQVLLQQQHQREDYMRQEQYTRMDHLGPPNSLPRAQTEQYPYHTQYFANDPTHSHTASSLDATPNNGPRAQTDSMAQLQAQLSAQPQTYSDAQNHAPHPPPHQQQQHSAPMHITLPSYQQQYLYDFSPGSPYSYEFYTASTKSMMAHGGGAAVSDGLQREMEYGGAIYDSHRAGAPQQAEQEPVQESRPVSPPTQDVPEQRQPAAQSTSNTTSGQSSAQSSQPATQVTSPTVASPTSAHSGSLHSHPAHPGPIALPPPVTAFPMPPPMSPVYHPQMSPYASPLHHPSVMMMTPFGLPPITPSMPSFQFVPQPSPGPAPASGSADLLSPTAPTHGGPSPNGAYDPQAQYPVHLRHAHGAMLSPYTPFSPGVAISPGAFWGRPGSGAMNPYINAAVGAPVHAQTGYFPPVPASLPPRGTAEEPQGYFPPFPAASSRPSGLANEITQDSASANGSAETGEGESAGGSVHGTPASEAEGRRPESAISEGTTTGTSTLTGTEASPRPASSTGTSWQTDSAGPSPLQGAEVKMQALAIADDSAKSRSAPTSASVCEGKVVGVVRASSDQAPTALQIKNVKTSGVDAASRPGVGTNGSSISDSAASN